MTVRQRTAVESLPDDIDSAQAKLVYLYLSTRGGTTAERIAADLGMTRISLFGVLGALAKQGFVEDDGETYRAVR